MSRTPLPALKELPRHVRADIEEAAALIKGMCDLYGAEIKTGYTVAGLIAEGLTQEWVKRQPAASDGRGEP